MTVMALTNVTDQDFRRQVLENDAPVVVAFRAAWCAESLRQASTLDDLEARFKGRVKVVGVDVADDPKANRICQQFQVNRLPVVMVFRGGRVADFVGGAASARIITEMVERQSRPVVSVGEHNFDAEVLKSPVPVLVHVDAAWCAQSRSLVPVVESMVQRFQGRAKVVQLEFGDANARLCAKYRFLRVPTVAVFDRGQVVDQIFGPMGDAGTASEGVRAPSAADTVAEMLEQFTR